LSIDEFENAPVKGNRLERCLQIISRRKPFAVRCAEEGSSLCRLKSATPRRQKRRWEKKASAFLLLLPNHAVASARFIVDQLRKWLQCKDAKISWMLVDEVADFESLMNDPV
jgi:hypothetical protein